MKHTSRLVVMAVGILILLSRVAPVRALQTTGTNSFGSALSKTSVVPAEDSGDDGDDGDSDDAD